MADYFLLEVYVHDLQFDTPVQQDERAPAPFALAFQFLDYPLLLTYASSSASFGSESVIRFAAGKSCILQEEAEELQFVLQQVRNPRQKAQQQHLQPHATPMLGTGTALCLALPCRHAATPSSHSLRQHPAIHF